MFLLALTAKTLALLRSRTEVFYYFCAQLLYTPVVFFGGKHFGVHSGTYLMLYVAATLPIIETACFILFRAQREQMITATIFGAFMGGIAANGMTHFGIADAVTFTEGVLLSIIGLGLLLTVPDSDDKTAVSVIGKFSLAMACFDFAYLLNDLRGLNKWVPSFVGLTCWLWIGLHGSTKSELRAG
jgi:hypothetical protein